jgi:hypothetical protein
LDHVGIIPPESVGARVAGLAQVRVGNPGVVLVSGGASANELRAREVVDPKEPGLIGELRRDTTCREVTVILGESGSLLISELSVL